MKTKQRHFSTGYTLLELLIAVMILGILAVVGLPNWFRYVSEQHLNQANEATETLLRTAQNRAKQEAQSFLVEFRMNNNIPQASLYRADSNANSCWTYLTSIGNQKSTRDDCLNLAEAGRITVSLIQGDTITFNYDGTISPSSELQPNKKVTFSLTGISNSPQRCVRIKTILGSIDKGIDSVECQQI